MKPPTETTPGPRSANPVLRGPDFLWYTGHHREIGVAMLLVKGRCKCPRDWPLLAGVKHGRCGYCNEYCEIVGFWDDEEDARRLEIAEEET